VPPTGGPAPCRRSADRLAGDGAHHRLVGVEHRLVEHLGQLLGGEGLHAPAALADMPSCVALARLEVVHELLQLGVGVASPIVYSRPRIEK
jgi:hypothetical protein